MPNLLDIKKQLKLLQQFGVPQEILESLDLSVKQVSEEISELEFKLSKKDIEVKGLKSAFHNSKVYLKKIINTVPTPVFVKNREHRWVLLNDAMCNFMGVDRQMLLGKSDYDFFPKRQADVFWEKDEEVFSTGKENINEEAFTTSSGKLYNVVTKKSLFIESSGEQFIVGSIQDISEIKEAKLKKKLYYQNIQFLSEKAMEFVRLPLDEDIYSFLAKNLYNLVDNSLVAISSYDPIRQSLQIQSLIGFPQVRETFFKLTGKSIKDKEFFVTEKGYKRLSSGKLEEVDEGLHQLSMQTIPKHICRLIESIFGLKRFYVIGFCQKDSLLGSIVIISKSNNDLKNIELIEAYTKQASVAIQKRNTEKALENSEEKYRQIFENIQNVYYEVTLDGKLLEISPSVSRFIKYTREELLGQNILQLYYDPKQRDEFLKEIGKKGSVQNFEIKIKDKDNKLIYSSTTSKLVLDCSGKPYKIIGSMIDSTELRKTNLELNKSQARYQELVDNIGEGVAIIDICDKIEFANPSAERIFGVDINGLNDKNINDFTESNLSLRISERQKSKNAETRSIFEINIIRPNKSKRNVIVIATSRFNQEGKFIGSFLVFRDLTNKRKINEALRRSEERYRELFRNANDLVYTMDFEGNFTSVNPIAENMLGYKFEELMERNMRNFITRASFDKSMQNIKHKLKGGKDRTKYDVEAISRNGKLVFLEINSILRYRNGEPHEIFGIARDITARRQSEEKIKNALKEKEVLLKEIHHRVKNNLQVIISLINFQMEKDLPESVVVNLRDLQDRIRSIALIHEDLYKAEDLASIDFKKYIQTLTANLFMISSNIPKLECIINVSDVSLEIEEAIPCGMIINELVSNSMKYAFPTSSNNKKPTITIDFQQTNNSRYQLLIKDNGIGFTPDISETKKKGSLGLWLVNILVSDQLNGNLELKNENGTIAAITFNSHK